MERPMPPFNADERATLDGWLEFHRATLANKCEGLDDAQAATVSAPPSPLSLTGLVQHMAEVERNWFQRILTAEPVPFLYDPGGDGEDGGFTVEAGATLSSALDIWRAEIDRAREICATHDLTDTAYLAEVKQDVSLRSIYIHMIEEYARHNGHADLIRERLDGVTGT